MSSRLHADASEAAPKDAVHDLLIRLSRHRGAGRLDAAFALLGSLAPAEAGLPAIRHEQALCLAARGQAEAAIALLRDCLAEQPDNPVLLTDLGVVLSQAAQREEGLKYLRSAAEMAPNYELAQANLGAALVLDRKYAEALQHLGKALALEPGLVDAANNFAQAALHMGRVNDAVDALYRALSADPGLAKTHAMLARALFRAERHDSALHHAQRALALAPEALDVGLLIAQIHTAAGRIADATDLLLKLSALPALRLQALLQLISLRKTEPGSPEAHQLPQLAQIAQDSAAERAGQIHMALGKAYNDLGEPALAFAQFRQGNDLAATLIRYDAAGASERAARLRYFASVEFLTRLAGAGHRGVQPVFVTGLPRSGTTLTEQMLSRHSALTAGGEMRATMTALAQSRRIHAALEERIPDADVTADDLAALGEAYEAGVRKTGLRGARFTDKMPANYLYIGLLARALPDARFLILHRHPLDVILSNYMQNFGQNQPMSHRLEDLAASYADFRALAAHWMAYLPDQVLEFHYEDLVAEPEAQMRRILGFLALEWEPDVLEHVKGERPVITASIAQVREPLYTRAIRRWERYAADLRPAAVLVSRWLTAEDRALCGLD